MDSYFGFPVAVLSGFRSLLRLVEVCASGNSSVWGLADARADLQESAGWASVTMCPFRFTCLLFTAAQNSEGLLVCEPLEGVKITSQLAPSGREKAHKHKLFALVNVQMALGTNG